MTDTQVRPRPPGATTRPPVADHKGALRKRRRKESLTAYLFLLPWFVGLIAITAGPLLTSLYLSFTDYSLIGDSNWVGFDNYIRMFQDDPRFIKALTNTAIYVFVSVPLQLAFASRWRWCSTGA